MLRLLETVDEVVDELGGTAAVARRYSTEQQPLTMQAVTNWRRRGRMSPSLCMVMLADLRAAGCEAAPELWTIRSPEPVCGAAS